MNAQPGTFRRRAVTFALAITLVLTSSVFAHADSASGRSEGSGFMIDGVWSSAVCAFSMALAKLDPGFYGSALMICFKAAALDN